MLMWWIANLPMILHDTCMYVCMSENLYPARIKQKSHSRAAVSNKQKRLQCPFEPFSGLHMSSSCRRSFMSTLIGRCSDQVEVAQLTVENSQTTTNYDKQPLVVQLRGSKRNCLGANWEVVMAALPRRTLQRCKWRRQPTRKKCGRRTSSTAGGMEAASRDRAQSWIETRLGRQGIIQIKSSITV